MDTEAITSQDRAGQPAGMGRVTFRASGLCAASPEAVYATLADIRTGLVWGGEQQMEKYRLLTMDAPEGQALVGTEWDSTGADPGGRFTDHSVVTRAERPALFEFRTEAHLEWKYGPSVAQVNHRYEIRPEGDGSRVAYLFRATGPVPMPWMMRAMLATLGIRQAMLRWSGPARAVQQGFANLLRLAESRAR